MAIAVRVILLEIFQPFLMLADDALILPTLLTVKMPVAAERMLRYLSAVCMNVNALDWFMRNVFICLKTLAILFILSFNGFRQKIIDFAESILKNNHIPEMQLYGFKSKNDGTKKEHIKN